MESLMVLDTSENNRKIATIGRKIASLRTLLSMSQEDFATQLCLDSRATIAKIESATSIEDISLDVQFRLSHFLNILSNCYQDRFYQTLSNEIFEIISDNINETIKKKSHSGTDKNENEKTSERAC